jgi:hypothetical protein
MSAAAGTSVTNLTRTFSLGPVKIQVFDIAIVSGDTTAVCTGDRMKTAYWAFMTSQPQTSAPTYSNGAVTFTFADPTANRFAQAIVFGI